MDKMKKILPFLMVIVIFGMTGCTQVTTQVTIQVTIHSPDNKTYINSDVDLKVTANKTIDTWMYSLDGGKNTTFTPNTTLTGLSDDSHTIEVYANDTAGNMGNNGTKFTVYIPSKGCIKVVGPGGIADEICW